MSDLLYGEIETDLRGGLRDLLTDRAPWTSVLAWTETGAPHDAALWDRLVTLDVTGLPVPEARGGAGVSWRETAVVLEELGRAVAPVPFLGSAVLATAAALAAGDETLLAGLADGSVIAAVAVPFGTAPGRPFTPTVRASGDRLWGTVTSVADALGASVLLVPAENGALYAVDVAEAQRTAVVSLDQTRPLADLVFDASPGRLVGSDGSALRAALTTGAGLLASEQLGLAEQCLETTIAYLKTRYQFGRQIGSYQGLKHRLADLWVGITQARAVARYAADCLATDDPDVPVAVALAQAHCSLVAVQAAEECVQMHGGIGFTWEHPAHLYLKRAKSTSLALGGPHAHRAVLGELTGLAP